MCIGLSEVMASAGKHQLLNFMEQLIPTIRTALCDRFAFLTYSCSYAILRLFIFLLLYITVQPSLHACYSSAEVRESAGVAFSTLYKVLL